MEQHQDDNFTSDYKGILIKFQDADNKIVYKRDRSGGQESVEVNGKNIGISNPSRKQPDRVFFIDDTEYSIAFGRKEFLSRVVECTLYKNKKPLQRYLLTAKSQINIWNKLLSVTIIGVIWLIYNLGLIPQVLAIILTITFILLRHAIQPIKQWSCEAVNLHGTE